MIFHFYSQTWGSYKIELIAKQKHYGGDYVLRTNSKTKALSRGLCTTCLYQDHIVHL